MPSKNRFGKLVMDALEDAIACTTLPPSYEDYELAKKTIKAACGKRMHVYDQALNFWCRAVGI